MPALSSKSQLQEMFLFAVIVLLAAFLRLYRLDQLPPGLHSDEAFKAVEARKVIAGIERPIFFRENLTEEPLMIYATALAFTLFGESTWALRLVSAMAGVLTVAALYLLARALFQSRGSAALAALVLAILYWHINFSRLGMEPILTPLMMTLAFAFLWRALQGDVWRVASGEDFSSSTRVTRHPSHTVDFALAGFFLGATQYTYKAALFIPLLVAAMIGTEIVADRGFWARHRRGLILCALVAVLVFAPLGLYFATHPNEFLERPGSVTAATSLSTTVENAVKVAGMFFVRGDDNPRSNLPNRPALDPFLALGFVVGLMVCLARLRRPASRFLLLWLAVMALPSGLSDFAPHFGRSIGVTPAVALIVAQGFGWLFEKIRAPRAAFAGILLAGLATSAYLSAHDYFEVWGTRTGLFDSFDVGYLTLAQKLRDRPANESIYISPVVQDHYTIQFGLAGRDVRSYDGRRVLVLPPPGTAVAYGIVTRDDARSLARLAQIFPNWRVVETIADFAGRPYASVFRAEDAPHIAPQKTVRARLGDTIELIGYDAAREGSTIALTVYWGSIAETREDYTVFAHLVGVFNPVIQSSVWAQDDGRPGRGSYPTSRWQAGEVVMDDYRLALPADAPGGEYQIEVGMYILKTGARVRLTDANGVPTENERVLLERISLP